MKKVLRKEVYQKILQWECNLAIQFHYSWMSLSWATVKVSDKDWKFIWNIELNREMIISFIYDWMIARAKGYDVD